MALSPVRVTPEVKDALDFLRIELSYKYRRNFALGDVIVSLVNGYKPGNPQLAENLREIISRIPAKET